MLHLFFLSFFFRVVVKCMIIMRKVKFLMVIIFSPPTAAGPCANFSEIYRSYCNYSGAPANKSVIAYLEGADTMQL